MRLGIMGPVRIACLGLALSLAACADSSSRRPTDREADPGVSTSVSIDLAEVASDGEAEPGVSASVRADLAEVKANAQRAMVLAERAGNVLIAECMEAKGHDFAGPIGADVDAVVGGLTIGELTPDVAREDGYSVYLGFPKDPIRPMRC